MGADFFSVVEMTQRWSIVEVVEEGVSVVERLECGGEEAYG